MDITPATLNRYRKFLAFLLKHRPDNLIERSEAEGEPRAEGGDIADAKTFVSDLEELGPCFVKLGQLLAARPDLLPPDYIEALERLQDAVEPFAGDEARAILEEELGVKASRAFASFDEKPLASASLGQVHRATLRDGREVVVKIQRPKLRARLTADLDALDNIAETLEKNTDAGRQYAVAGMLRDFRRTLFRELDYREEAQNMLRLGKALESYKRLLVPQAIADFTTQRVLTMEYVHGVGIGALSPVVRLEVDGTELATQLAKAYLQQILVDGFFHADPHPGNVLLTPDRNLALLDVGMVGYLDPKPRAELLKLLLAISEGRGQEAAAIASFLGHREEEFDEVRFAQEVGDLVARKVGQPLGRIQTGRILLHVARTGAECGLRPAPELAVLGRTLVHLDALACELDPEFDPNAIVKEEAARMVRSRMLESLTPGEMFRSLLETHELMRALPGHANRILGDLAGGRMRVRVDAFDERAFLQGFQKVANRIATGLVLAALIVGAALTMNVESRFRLLGYPGLSIILFLGAALGGIALIVSILRRDTPPPEER